jgi:protein-tyrosine phosphatase
MTKDDLYEIKNQANLYACMGATIDHLYPSWKEFTKEEALKVLNEVTIDSELFDFIETHTKEESENEIERCLDISDFVLTRSELEVIPLTLNLTKS